MCLCERCAFVYGCIRVHAGSYVSVCLSLCVHQCADSCLVCVCLGSVCAYAFMFVCFGGRFYVCAFVSVRVA